MKRTATAACVVLIFVGIHTELGVASGGQLVIPYALSALGAVGAMLLNPRMVTVRIVMLFASIGSVLCGCVVLTWGLGNDSMQHVISSADLLYSLFIGFGAAIGIVAVGSRVASKIFLGIVVVVVIGSVLELYGGLRPISDAFRETLIRFRPVYSDIGRDENQYGGIRPNFFAPEPSVVGITCGLGLLLWFLGGRSYSAKRWWTAAVVAAVSFIVVRSPTILVCLATALLYLCEGVLRRKRARRYLTFVLGVLTLVFAVAVPSVIALVSQYGRSGSFFEREILPPIIAVKVLAIHPLFGSGLGGYGAWAGPLYDAYIQTGGFASHPDRAMDILSGMSSRYFLVNQFWEYWVDLGIGGGMAVAYLLYRLLRETKVPNPQIIFWATALVMTMWGGVTSCPGWVAFFSMAAIYSLQGDVDHAMEGEPVAPIGVISTEEYETRSAIAR